MSLYNLTEATTPDGIIIGLASSVPVFPIMFLTFIWFFVFLGGSLKQNSKYGYSDMPQWSLLASISILLLGLLMTITTGLLPAATLGIIVSINILCSVWYFMSRGRIE